MTSSTAYVFPGEGSQVVGMGQALAVAYSARADAFAEADEILGFALSALCFDGPSDVLTDMCNAQPAIMTASIAAWRAVGTAHPELPGPLCVAGHRLGEYSALVAAGALAFADAIQAHPRGSPDGAGRHGRAGQHGCGPQVGGRAGRRPLPPGRVRVG